MPPPPPARSLPSPVTAFFDIFAVTTATDVTSMTTTNVISARTTRRTAPLRMSGCRAPLPARIGNMSLSEGAQRTFVSATPMGTRSGADQTMAGDSDESQYGRRLRHRRDGAAKAKVNLQMKWVVRTAALIRRRHTIDADLPQRR